MAVPRTGPRHEVTIPRDQAWFWSQGWQEKEREADEAIERGEISGPFESPDALLRHLRDA